MKNSYDPASITADSLLNYFSRNTALKVEHRFMSDTLEVKSARTGNVIATVKRDGELYVVDGVHDFLSLEFVATFISGMRRFPKPKNTKKAWSPIRFNAKAIELMNSDSGIRFS